MVTGDATPRNSGDIGDFFARQWAPYQACLRTNILRHREFFEVLQGEFRERIPEGGSVLDLACGDASSIAGILPPGVRYTGVDLAGTALAFAVEILSNAGVSHELVEKEFREHVRGCGAEPGYDGVVISYSLHHLETSAKQEVLDQTCRILKPGGNLWVIDGIRQHGDDREAWLDRLWGFMEREGRPHHISEELREIRNHIWTSDFPESAPGYAAMAMRSGFGRWDFLKEEGDGSLGMFRATKEGGPGSGVGGVKQD